MYFKLIYFKNIPRRFYELSYSLFELRFLYSLYKIWDKKVFLILVYCLLNCWVKVKVLYYQQKETKKFKLISILKSTISTFGAEFFRIKNIFHT